MNPQQPNGNGKTPGRKESRAGYPVLWESPPSPREASDIRLRERVTWAVIGYYGLLLVAVLVLFYLQGLGVIELSDPAIVALAAVLIGNTAAGALLLQVIKGIFPN